MNIDQVSETMCRQSEEYYSARVRSAQARIDFDILMLPHLDNFPKSMSYEKMCLMFCKDNEQAQQLYRTWHEQEATYKGLDNIISANESRISFEQSKMKYQHQGEQRGY